MKNIKIVYTVELEEVLTEVKRILEKAQLQLQVSAKDLERTITSGLTDESVLSIDKIRKKMFIIDSTLADSHSILEGFFLTKASELVQKSYEQEQARLKGEQNVANKDKSKDDIHSVGGET